MGKRWQRWIAVASIPLLLGGEGCLSRNYLISQVELLRLSRLPPGERWQAVRATQGLGGDDVPPDGVTIHPASTVIATPVSFASSGRWRLTPPQMDVRWSPRASALGASSGLTLGGSPMGTGSGRSSGGSSRSGGGGGGDGAAVAVLVAAVLAAGVIVFVLAGTEGARYDGWIAVNPNEELYIMRPRGQVLAVPMSALTPELVQDAYSAQIYEGPDDRYARLARAPLNRVGLTLTTGVGMAGLPADGVARMQAAFSGHTFLGYFPSQGMGFGIATDVLARNALVGTIGPEIRVMPHLNAGAYVGAGLALGRTGGTEAQGFFGYFARVGFLGELPVTTRMALQLRAGAARMTFHEIGSVIVPEASVALAIY